MSGKVNQNKTDKNNESSGSEQQFGETEPTTSIQDKAWQDQRNEEGENEKAESIISHDTVLKNGEDSSFSQIGINDTSNDHIYDPKKEMKEKQKAKTSSGSNKWSTEPYSTYKPYSGTGSSSNLKSFCNCKTISSNNLQDDEEPEEQTPINEAEQNKIMFQFFQQAQKFYAKGVEPRKSRLVDFPVFKGGNQDPVGWIEAFSRACVANRVSEERAIVLVASYLKGTALTWYNRQNIIFWENDNSPQQSFTHLFKDHFCNPFRISQWKHQLRNRKQKQGETIEEYIAAITELWKRVDPTDRRMELDKIHEFIEG
ncbi:unnamed protein product [Rhizophagus irregularis]|nr:unnamed protein product [Rhizophagus irregularis]